MRNSALVVLACALFLVSLVDAATLPEDFIETPVASGLVMPTAMVFAPDGRLFVCEKTGAVRVVRDGALLTAPFVRLSVNSGGEGGLLGIALDPNFAANHWIYLYYTATMPTSHNRISRFTSAGDVAQDGTELVILDIDDPVSGIHNGGAIHFGADGLLYAAVGNYGDGSNSQTLTNMMGKILRIRNDGTIPADNPFYNQAMGQNRAIWAFGLRNPFTFAFQHGTGRMFINDVGEGSWEEIDDGIVGSNYGWPAAQGIDQCSTYRCPLYAYDHSNGSCAITGGSFYDPTTPQFPSIYQGQYFFSDFCGGWIRVLDPATGVATNFASAPIGGPVDLAVGPDGLLYYLAFWEGTVHKIALAELPSMNSVDRITGNSAVLHGSVWDGREASQWQVDELGEDFSSPVVNSGRTTSALSSFKATGLNAITTYQSRVRYQDAAGVWSLWSNPQFDPNDQFTTLVGTAVTPVVVDVVPAPSSSAVVVSVSPALTFNVPIAALSASSATVRLVRRTAPSVNVSASLSLDDSEAIVTIAPADLLDPDSNYKIQVVGGRRGIESRDGAISGKSFTALFSTETALVSSRPMAGATGVALTVALQVDFKWVLDPATTNPRTFKLKDVSSGRNVPLASVIASGATVTVTPLAPLRSSHKYVLSVAPGPTGLRFADGRHVGAKITVDFKTVP